MKVMKAWFAKNQIAILATLVASFGLLQVVHTSINRDVQRTTFESIRQLRERVKDIETQEHIREIEAIQESVK